MEDLQRCLLIVNPVIRINRERGTGNRERGTGNREQGLSMTRDLSYRQDLPPIGGGLKPIETDFPVARCPLRVSTTSSLSH